MTASTINTLTACIWPGCPNPGDRSKGCCARDYSRAILLVKEAGATWEAPENWPALWAARSVEMKARQVENGKRAAAARNARPRQKPAPFHGLGVVVAAESKVASVPPEAAREAVETVAPSAAAEPDRSTWPELVAAVAPRLYNWPNGERAIIECGGGYRAYWPHNVDPIGHAGDYDSFRAAADAIEARLPAKSATAKQDWSKPWPNVYREPRHDWQREQDARQGLHRLRPPGPTGFRCIERAGSGEQCIKEMVRMDNGDLIHGGGHTYIAGDTSQHLGGHIPAQVQAPAAPTTTSALANLHAAVGGALDGVSMREALGTPEDPRDAEIAKLRATLAEVTKGAKVVDFLRGDAHLSDKSRRVVALNTAALRALAQSTVDSLNIAMDLIADTIDAECGVERG